MRGYYFQSVGTLTRAVRWPGERDLCQHYTYLVLLGGVGACFPGFPPPAAPRLSWTTVDLLDKMAEAGAGPEPGRETPRGEGRESSRGCLAFLLGSTGV